MKWEYEIFSETIHGYDCDYVTYSIRVCEMENEVTFHDVSTKKDRAQRLCVILNREHPNPEQAGYLVEDFVHEAYLAA